MKSSFVAKTVYAVAILLFPFNTFAQSQFVPHRILIQPRAGVTDKSIEKILSVHGGKRVGKIDAINVHIIELPANVNEKNIASILARHPQLKFAQVDTIVEPAQILSDPLFSSEWHIADIGAAQAWNMSQGSGVTIAILDTGTDGTHPDLTAHMVPGWNFYDNNSNTSDVVGHGTKTAGVAGAIGNNSQGVAGVAYNASIMPVRISSPSGSASTSTIATGLIWAADHGARVASISYGIATDPTTINAAQYFKNKGGLVVSAAGNSTSQVGCESNSGYIITVSATDQMDHLASFSSYGPCVDVAAPGVGIYTTAMGGGYAAPTGTSFSSPMVAGVIALMMSANPSLSGSQIQSLLNSTATDLGTPGYDIYYGYGRVNAAAAVSAATTAGAFIDSQAPTVSINPSVSSAVLGIIPINATASDNVGVTRAEMYVGGLYDGGKLIATDTLSPYGFSWDTTTVADGTYKVTVKAYDAAGNMGISSVNITVKNDTTPPSAPTNLTAAYDNTTALHVNLSWTASTDNKRVAYYKVYRSGAFFASTTSTSFQDTSYFSRRMQLTYYVVAVDASGNVSPASNTASTK